MDMLQPGISTDKETCLGLSNSSHRCHDQQLVEDVWVPVVQPHNPRPGHDTLHDGAKGRLRGGGKHAQSASLQEAMIRIQTYSACQETIVDPARHDVWFDLLLLIIQH